MRKILTAEIALYDQDHSVKSKTTDEKTQVITEYVLTY